MIDFENYFCFNLIVDQLAQHRANLSFYIHKNIYLERYCKQKKWELKDPYKISDQEFLQSLLPPRREWSRPKGHLQRKPFSSSIDLNKASIKKRIKIVHHRFLDGKIEFKNTPLWYQKLRYFVFELNIEVLQDPNLKLKKPDIFPAKKKPEDKFNTERRPLAKSFLKDKIILSLTNKYLTKAFDRLFLDCSFAFRAQDGYGNTPTYHHAIKSLQSFRIKHTDKPLYAAECDIKKFFDCLDHDVIQRHYILLKEALAIQGIHIHPAAERLFLSYLDFYSFDQDVYPKNGDIAYWRDVRDDSPMGHFCWVQQMIDKIANDKKKRIGIPQGGALSGLIVNIVMHSADQIICANKGLNEDFIYLRYCDDMVIIHSDPQACASIFNSYIYKLKELQLVTHDCKMPLAKYNKEFWNDVKSRDVYLWSRKRNDNYPNAPWISFLGYMVGDKGDLKVRRRSLQKQKDKHLLEIRKVIKKLNHQSDETLLEAKDSIYHSVSHKMASMAVGKVDISDYKTSNVKMCWAAGFKLLEYNKYSGQQLRLMDRSRQEGLLHLRKYLKKRTASLEESQPAVSSAENGEILQEIAEARKEKKDTIFPKYPHSFFSMFDREKKM